MFRKILYAIWVIILVIVVFFCAKNPTTKNFLTIVENRTFDLRQSILAQTHDRMPSDKILIVAIDDATYEYVLDKYGEWPMPRELYIKVVDYIEKQNPNAIAFDLMFVKSIKSSVDADKAIGEMARKYNNVFFAMNFDNQEASLRKPPRLPISITTPVDNNSAFVDLDYNSYSNCRAIINEILHNTSNIAFTNVTRAEDGILRKLPVFMKYQHNYYPQLAFKVGLHYLKSQGVYDGKGRFVIEPSSKLKVGNRVLPLENDGTVLLNWYNPAGYKYLSLYKLILAAEGELKDFSYDFSDKLIYFGATASSLYDIKTVPVNRNFPGVAVQTTYLNNMMDNSFIKHLDKSITTEISIVLALITLLIVLSEDSVMLGTLLSFSVYLIYLAITYLVMRYFNWWIDIVIPLLSSIVTLIAAYILKYVMKARDFDRQYLLATTDGLTELYNHRYFKEQMRLMIDSSKRYGSQFSLIILDIDFFKKFNDTYGHQSGDAVLKQVAQTLKRNTRSSDIVCRYGGEEMSIILNNTDYVTAFNIAQKICNKVAANPFRLPHGVDVNVTVSLGVSTFPKDGISIEELVDVADGHLYNAKENGRNQVGK